MTGTAPELTPATPQQVELAATAPERGFCAWLEGALWLCLPVWILACVFSTWLFAIGYVPTIDHAHSSFIFAAGESGQNPAWGLRWSAETLTVIGVLLLLVTMWWRRDWTDRQRIRSWCLLLIVGVAVASWSFFGQLLPMDQPAWHGTAVRAGIIQSIPVVGELKHNLIFGSQGLSGQTVTRFHLLHVAVLPALLLILAGFIMLRVWRTSDWASRKPWPILGALILLIQLFLLTRGSFECLMPGISARPDVTDPNVRPEWFFLPLNRLMALMPPGPLEQLAAALPGLLLPVLFFWPRLSRRVGRRGDFAVLCLVSAVFLGLLAEGVGRDASNNTGWFAEHDLEALMTEAGKLNDKIGRAGEISPHAAFAAAADFRVMARQTRHLANHPDVRNSAKWRQWSTEWESASNAIWASPQPDAIANAIAKLRAACQSCHDAHEVEADMLSKPLPTVPEPVQVEPSVASAPDTWPNFLRPGAFDNLKASSDIPTKLKALMTRMNDGWELLAAVDPATAAQAILDSEAQWQALLKQYDPELADGIMTAEEWETWTRRGLAATVALRQPLPEPEYRRQLEEVRASCAGCHEGMFVEDAELKPIRSK